MSNSAAKSINSHSFNSINDYPSTRFMGSKEKILEHIWGIASKFDFNSALDLFSGSGVVSYMFKTKGKRVISNDYMHMSYAFTKALVENNSTIITTDDIETVLTPVKNQELFVTNKFKDLYYTETDNNFIDLIRGNLKLIDGEYKKHLLLSSLIRACLKKRARGIFTYTGFRYNDGRKDLKLSLQEHFLNAVEVYNNAVFDNGCENISFNEDSLELDAEADLIYMDPPYYSKYSDNDYIRRYHFVEGLARDWDGINFQEHTKTKKFKSYESPFRKKESTYNAFEHLIKKYSNKIVIISYSSNSLPSKEDLLEMLNRNFSNVEVHGIDYKYSFGNQSHKVGDNNNGASEYLFVAY